LKTPVVTDKMPRGVGNILSQETFERFSFYGMRSILVVFMTQYLLGAGGVMPASKAIFWYHWFVAFTYLMPVLGAMISDAFLGKFKTIIIFSIINVLGLVALVVDQTRIGLFSGLILIAIGSGFIKPCVSANVGDQFGKKNKHLLEKVYGWFYFVINFGSFFSYMLIPVLLDKYSPDKGFDSHLAPRIAFSVPAISMLLATLTFLMGHKKFVHAPPSGIGHIKESLKGEGLEILGRLGVLFLFIAMFWSLFNQMDSSLMLLTRDMDRDVFGIQLLPAQLGAANPLIVMALIPIFSFCIYPALNKIFRVTPLRKITIGMFVAAAAFVVPALIEISISELRYDGQAIGKMTLNGKIKDDLKIEFDSDAADADAVRGLLASIQFDNSNTDPNVVGRVANLTLVDSAGEKMTGDITIGINDPNNAQSAEFIKGKAVVFKVGDGPVGIGASAIRIADDANYKGGHLLVNRKAGFTTSDTLSININADGDSKVSTGIDRDTPSIGWLFLAVLILTIAEVMVSITILEFSYTQAPKEMKSLIMSISSLSVFLGNMFAAVVNSFGDNLKGASYFWFFAGAMALTAIVFIPFAAKYKEHTYVGDEE